jgi:hypothetical protein
MMAATYVVAHTPVSRQLYGPYFSAPNLWTHAVCSMAYGGINASGVFVAPIAPLGSFGVVMF